MSTEIVQLLISFASLVAINAIPIAGVFMGAYWINGDWNHPLLYVSTVFAIVLFPYQFLFWWWVTGTIVGIFIALLHPVHHLHSEETI